ncbi:MAG: SOS response-associated peptidase [Candidatus Omnitrophota bacterium]
MCGRYSFIKTNAKELAERFDLLDLSINVKPDHNIAPLAQVPVILNTSPRSLTLLRWGLIPYWAKDKAIGNKMINARAETIFEKPSFKDPISQKRCLILADAFFEWKKGGTKKKPYKISLKSQEPFAFAGIWDRWISGGEEILSCSIVTTEPNSLIAPIHHRMPVILPKDCEQKWLSRLSRKDIELFLKPFDNSQMSVEPALSNNNPLEVPIMASWPS